MLSVLVLKELYYHFNKIVNVHSFDTSELLNTLYIQCISISFSDINIIKIV